MLKSNANKTTKKRSADVLNNGIDNDREKRARTSAPTTPTLTTPPPNLPSDTLLTSSLSLSPAQIADLKRLLVASMQDRINQLEDDVIYNHETQTNQALQIAQLSQEVAQLQLRLQHLEHSHQASTSESPQQSRSLSALTISTTPTQIATPRFFQPVMLTSSTHIEQSQTWVQTDLRGTQLDH